MLQSSTLQFLQSLQKNNNKPWFDENRKKYESAKENFAEFVEALINGIAAFDPTIQNLTAKNCMFRINRDVRFSKDKSPYKTNMGASISKGGKKINLAGYYFHCEPGKSFAAGGFYMPMAPELAKIRQEIDYNFKEWIPTDIELLDLFLSEISTCKYMYNDLKSPYIKIIRTTFN
jgi:uncharacterized protein (TIGR02453 family)